MPSSFRASFSSQALDQREHQPSILCIQCLEQIGRRRARHSTLSEGAKLFERVRELTVSVFTQAIQRPAPGYPREPKGRFRAHTGLTTANPTEM